MAQLVSAVKEIVHPNANPTPGMIMIAQSQGGPPKNLIQMVRYMPEMVKLAKHIGVKPPGTTGAVTVKDLQKYITERGLKWMNKQANFAGMTGGEIGLGTDTTVLGGITTADQKPAATAQQNTSTKSGSSTPTKSQTVTTPQKQPMTSMNSFQGSPFGMGGFGLMGMADMDYPLYPMGGMGMMGMGGMGMGMGGMGMSGGPGMMGRNTFMNMHYLDMDHPLM